MKIITESTAPQLETLNEMYIHIADNLPNTVEQSIYYAKLKQLLHGEIFNFCKEQTDLKQDLNILRMSIGIAMPEKEIREYLDGLKEKYNEHYDNVALEYHIEQTRVDFGVPVFVIIKRGEIFAKKFVFRFKKSSAAESLDGLTIGQVPTKED